VTERSAIRITDFTKVYRGFGQRPHTAVEDLSLEVTEGEVFGFLGPNGAGKSTTIKSLLGFLRPTRGRLEILGQSHSDVTTRRRIGYLPEVASYYHYLTPREMLRFYAKIFRLPRAGLSRRVDEVLDRVGLLPQADRRVGTFSKGMTQRVGIAQALINDPDLLILDEPTTGLDPLGQREIRDLIADLRARGKTVFFSSHELSRVEEVCDRAAILRQGRLVRLGALDELMPPQHGLEAVVAELDESALNGRSPWPVQVLSRRSAEVTVFLEGASDLSAALNLFSGLGAEVRLIERRRPRLEDVFVEAVSGEER
jgi:ABC-2 type transport system ATP-binding protein